MKFINKWTAAAEKGKIKTLDAAHVVKHFPQESATDP